MHLFKKIKYINISARISILLGIVIIIAMGAFSIFSLIEQEKDSIIAINNNTRQLSQTIEKILRVSMLKNRREDISLAVNNIVGNEGIKSVRILNHSGTIEFSSKQSEINKNISNNNFLCLSCHKSKNYGEVDKSVKNFDFYKIDKKNYLIYSSLAIYNAPSCYNGVCHSTGIPPSTLKNEKLKKYSEKMNPGASSNGNNLTSFSYHDSSQTILGFIEIDVSIKSIISNIEKTRTQLLLLTVLFALIASLMTYFLIRYFIGKPVKNLVDGTRRVAQGDFKHEIPPGKAELRILSESFNKMQKQLVTTQNQLIESEKLASIGKLADEIANEINNPLTGIIIYSESLIEESGNTDDKREDYELIRQEALKIRESIKNILTFTRKEKPDFNMTDIGNVIRHSISIVEKFSNFRNIQIITNISKTVPDVSADSGLMEQVFLNLLLISSESMQAGGILNISVQYKENNKEVEIGFSDTGNGIPENVLHEILNPDSTPVAGKFERIGISLAVCKDIIEMHKGKLIINSNGNGNSIIILLPV